MPTLTERVEADYKTALRAGERLRVDTLRLIKAAMQRVAIEKRKDKLDDSEVIPVLSQQAKQRQETIESARRNNRQDVVDQATAEMAILKQYLPQAMAPEAVRQLIEEAVASVGLNQGQIMKYVMAKAAGAADGRVVSQLVAERLTKGS